MDATQKDQPKQSQVSVPVRGAEGPRVSVEAPVGRVEDYLTPSDVEPQIHPEAREHVQPVQTPRLDQAAQNAGVSESIPHGPVFGNLPTDQHIAHQAYSSGDSSTSGPWRALIALKEIAKGLLRPRNPQGAN